MPPSRVGCEPCILPSHLAHQPCPDSSLTLGVQSMRGARKPLPLSGKTKSRKELQPGRRVGYAWYTSWRRSLTRPSRVTPSWRTAWRARANAPAHTQAASAAVSGPQCTGALLLCSQGPQWRFKQRVSVAPGPWLGSAGHSWGPSGRSAWLPRLRCPPPPPSGALAWTAWFLAPRCTSELWKKDWKPIGRGARPLPCSCLIPSPGGALACAAGPLRDGCYHPVATQGHTVRRIVNIWSTTGQ